MKQVTDYFGCRVFSDKVMKSKLSSDVYKKLKRTINEGSELDISVANSVAQAMKALISMTICMIWTCVKNLQQRIDLKLQEE